MRRKSVVLGYLAAVFWLMFALNACVKAGPDYARPKPGFELKNQYHQSLKKASRDASRDVVFSSAKELSRDRWWEVFGDPSLNDIVNGVLTNNLDIKKAAAVVREVLAYFKQAKADSWPKLSAEFSKSASEQVLRGVGAFGGEKGYITLSSSEYGLSFPVSYELDLWGRVARSRESALASLWESEENRLVVVQTMVAESVNLYLTIESLERLILIKRKNIKSCEDSLNLVRGRYERGLSPLLEVSQAGLLLSQTMAELPELRRRLGEAQQSLAVMLGKYPVVSPPRSQPEDYYQRLEEVPAGLPSDLLKRRPDVRKAEAKLISLNAGVGFAKASRFPSFSLTGAFGYSSGELENLFDESRVWSVRAGITQAIFYGGKLVAAQKAAEARYDQGVIDYHKTMLLALREVEKALLNRKELMKKRELTLKFLNEARLNQKIAEDRYERGLVDYQKILDAMRTRFGTETALVQADLSLMQNRVNLHKNLGGGWGATDESREQNGNSEGKNRNPAGKAILINNSNRGD